MGDALEENHFGQFALNLIWQPAIALANTELSKPLLYRQMFIYYFDESLKPALDIATISIHCMSLTRDVANGKAGNIFFPAYMAEQAQDLQKLTLTY